MITPIAKGIELLEDIPGQGLAADKGCNVTYNARLFLRKGDEVTGDAQSIALCGARLNTRTIDGVELINHKILLGKRQAIAGVEKSLFGMRPAGYREVMVSAHLAYSEAGIPELIPSNAMLRIRLWVQDVQVAIWPPPA